MVYWKKIKKNSTLNSNFHCSADSEVTGTVIRGAPDSVIATEIQFIIHKDEINAPAISIKSREQWFSPLVFAFLKN